MKYYVFEAQYGQNYKWTFQWATICLVDQLETAPALFVQLLPVLSGSDSPPHFFFFFFAFVFANLRNDGKYRTVHPLVKQVLISWKFIFGISLKPAV